VLGIAGRAAGAMLRGVITRQTFGRTADGTEVGVYEITNASGASVRLLDYGGIVQGLRVPDRAEKPADVVLGGADLDFYLRRHPYFGCLTGRVAGRITRGELKIGGKDYLLAVNNAPNHLHGGVTGLDRRIWQAEPGGDDKLVLRYRSPAGEEGYPGNADLKVSYRWTERNELVIASEVQVDEPTPVSLTNHSYFNLAGEGSGPVDDHRVQILADEYVPAADDLTLSGVRRPVAGANDLRQPARFGDFVAGLHLQHGDNYLLEPSGGTVVTVARVHEPNSGRTLEVRTNEACLQFYTGSFLDGSFTGKSGVAYGRHHGLCLECQGYPDGVEHPELGDILVHPGPPRRKTTIYAFGVTAD
jgi:aldose 1-epimerase